MDEFVEVENGEFVTTLKSGDKINISNKLFAHFIDQIHVTNQSIKGKGYVLHGKGFRPSSTNNQASSFKTKRFKIAPVETTGGGVDQVMYTIYWHGVDVDIYISNGSLFNAGTLLVAASPWISKIPDSRVRFAVTCCCTLATAACGHLVYHYPNGVIVSIYHLFSTTQCIPYSLVSL